MPDGHLMGDVVVVPAGPQADKLHDRHGTGARGNDGLELARIEAAWHVAGGRLRVLDRNGEVDVARLIAGVDVAYIAYLDLKERGLGVVVEGETLSVTDRAGQTRRVEVWSETARPAADHFVDAAPCIAALVDEDGVVTYYGIDSVELRGGVAPPSGDWPLTRLGERYLVPGGACPGAERAFAGTPIPPDLVLSPLEAAWLGKLGVVPEVAPPPGPVWPVYLDLRRRGLVARSGFRFGTHLRAYQGDPDAGHAQWLVQAVPATQRIVWSAVARGVRLAHGVRKSFLLAVVGETVHHVKLTWVRL